MKRELVRKLSSSFAILCRFLSRPERFCVDREECSQREVENSEYHPDYQPHEAADQQEFHFAHPVCEPFAGNPESQTILRSRRSVAEETDLA